VSDLSDPDTPLPVKRKRRIKPDAEIVLLCNPRAGGRWTELGRILDSAEASFARRIVTDSVEDVAPALADLGREAKLLCIYGGDGTIQRILDRLSPSIRDDIQLALIGGGTMNVTARWCGMSRSASENFSAVVRAYRTGQQLLREVPLLRVQRGDDVHYGFTFGVGPIVRVLDAYERGRKGKKAALAMGIRAISASWLGYPSRFRPLIAPMEAEVHMDGQLLPYSKFSALFGNVTGQLNPGVSPFVEQRTRDSFYCAAYAVTARELSLNLPALIRGWLPVDASMLLRLPFLWKKPDSDGSDGSDGDAPAHTGLPLPTDPRYINRVAHTLEIHTDEELYTVDGELLSSGTGPITVELGPFLKLAVRPR
jgi:diacylglycerol kinase family enzyme